MGRRQSTPFNATTIETQELPFTRAGKVLVTDPALIKRLEHIARPYRGGETLVKNPDRIHPGEPIYIDLETFCEVLLNEVVHLRHQIGLVCKGAYEATGGGFKVNIDPPHGVPGPEKSIMTAPLLEDYAYSKSTMDALKKRRPQ